MRVLTVKQPWAAAIIFGGKTVENRTRSLGPYTGPVAIHAGLQFDHARSGDAMVLVEQELGEEELGRRMVNDFLLLGHILGVVDIVSSHESTFFHGCRSAQHQGSGPAPLCSPWAERDRFHYVLANPRPLFQPIEYRGGLSLRNLAPDVEAQIRAEVDRPPAADVQEWERMLPDHSFLRERVNVVTHFCGWKTRSWPDENDVALNEHLADCHAVRYD